MVKLIFNKAVLKQREDWRYEDAGTFAENIGDTYRVKFSKANLAGKSRVTILLSETGNYEQDGELLYCTVALSEWIRGAVTRMSQEDVMCHLLKLSILVDKDDRSKYFLAMPRKEGAGNMLPDFQVDELKAHQPREKFEDAF